jgi:hypothetical protein
MLLTRGEYREPDAVNNGINKFIFVLNRFNYVLPAPCPLVRRRRRPGIIARKACTRYTPS